MKTILIFHSDQYSIAKLQSALSGKCYLYATSRIQMAIEFLSQNPVDALIIHLPAFSAREMNQTCIRLLKRLTKPEFSNILKIVVCSNQEERSVKEFMRLGVTAIVGEMEGLRMVLGLEREA